MDILIKIIITAAIITISCAYGIIIFGSDAALKDIFRTVAGVSICTIIVCSIIKVWISK